MIFKLRSTLAVLASTVVFSGVVAAQANYKTSNNDYSDDGVTVYEHCDFKGKSQTLRPGEYPSLRDTGFGNDRVSSIRVPRGSEAVIYQDDDYRGSYARIDRDIRCFDRKWNNKASSISVREVAYSNRDSRRNSNRNSRDSRRSGADDRGYDGGGYDGRDYDNQNRDNRRRDQRRNNNHQNQATVTAKNISQVVFDGISLQQISTKQWSLDIKRGESKQFQEVRRDRDSVYLENKYTAERVRIDLFANDVTFVGRNGRQQRYNIDHKNAALGSNFNTRPNRPAPAVSSSPNTRIRADCFNYKAYTKGGRAGVRFHGKEGFFPFNNKPATGRICHKGPLTMEINKREFATAVTIEINGNRYNFSAGEKEDKLLNNWYRKSVKLIVGK